MGLKCGIIGITNTGKTTLFNCISETKVATSNFAFSTNKSNLGQVKVPDERLLKLDSLIHSARVMPTTVDVVDIPGLTKGSSKGEGIGNSFLADIRNCDALIHVVRCFDDPNLPHIDTTINPVRDRETIDLELQVKDLDAIDKRILKLEKSVKAGDKASKHGLEVVTRIKTHLEDFKNVRTLHLSREDEEHIAELCLLTAKPVIYVCNVDEKSAVTGNMYSNRFIESIQGEKTETLIIAAKAESEIAELEDPEDRLAFLSELQLDEPGVNKLIRSAFSILNLEVFFTAGPKEVRAWTIRKGATAPQAAGVIHSDLQRGFIRAEVIQYKDYITFKTEAACREAGKLFIEGKNYIVEDGDILHIRFNV
ncbi:MAG: redox-regulated ATPase YchF [Bacteroidales bacterium]